MTKRSLADLSAAFAQKASNQDQSWKKFFPFWKAPEGSTSTVRFLPDLDEENSMGFLVENFVHELVINGKREKVACLKMYGDECPICALSQDHYDEKSPNYSEQLGKKYYRKKSYIGQILVMDTLVEHDQEQLVKLIDFGPAIFKQVQAAFQSGDLEAPPYELKGGYNFRINKTKAGEYASYQTSSFSPKRTDVSDEVLAAIELYDLKTFRTPKTSREHLEAMLIADQTGISMPMDSVEETPAKPVQAPAPTLAAKTTAAPTSAAPATAAPKMSVIEQLRMRQAAKAAQERDA